MGLDNVAEKIDSAEYHAFYRTPRFRWWQSLLALALFGACWGAGVLTAAIVAVIYEVVAGGATVEQLGNGVQTPALFVANNLGVALAIPAAVVTQWIMFRQRAGWLFSVQGRLRWQLLGPCVLIAALIHVTTLATWLVIVGPPEGLGMRTETWFLLAAILLTTPLQAAGEEVAFRGLGTRAIGSCFDDQRLGLVVATASTSLVFAMAHGSLDVWLLLFYLTLGIAASLLTWQAGGLEPAIALHVVVNLTTMLFLPFLGLASGAVPEHPGLQAFTQVLAIIATSIALVWYIRREAPTRRADPGIASGVRL